MNGSYGRSSDIVSHTHSPARFPRNEGASGNVSEHYASRSTWPSSWTVVNTVKIGSEYIHVVDSSLGSQSAKKEKHINFLYEETLGLSISRLEGPTRPQPHMLHSDDSWAMTCRLKSYVHQIRIHNMLNDNTDKNSFHIKIQIWRWTNSPEEVRSLPISHLDGSSHTWPHTQDLGCLSCGWFWQRGSHATEATPSIVGVMASRIA